jgi:hypothetical protein
MTEAVDARRVVERVTLTALFAGFLKVSLFGFGGGLIWARRIVVEQQQWVNDQEFAEILTLCQFMPGPNMVGITTCVGSKLRGTVGANRRGLRFHSDTLDNRVVARRLLSPLRAPWGPPEHSRRAFRC